MEVVPIPRMVLKVWASIVGFNEEAGINSGCLVEAYSEGRPSGLHARVGLMNVGGGDEMCGQRA